MFWRRNSNIQSFQLSEMGLAYVDSNTSDAGEILSGSYPQLNKNNIIWSNFVISADGSRFPEGKFVADFTDKLFF